MYGGSLFLTGRTMVGPLTLGHRRDIDWIPGARG